MWFHRFKVLPLLILVCIMAFSMRIVDLADGLTAQTKPALAVEETDEDAVIDLGGNDGAEEAPSTEENSTLFSFGGSDNAGDQGEEHAAAEDEKEPGKDKPARYRPKWVDATDSDLEFTDVKMEMFQNLTERRKTLDEREKELAAREALLSAAEQELERKVQELAVIRREIEALLDQQSEQEEDRVKSLVKIYEGMKAKEAAEIFNTLDLDILVSVVSNMSERKLSPIMAAMKPERARTVTIMLAEQKQLPVLPE